MRVLRFEIPPACEGMTVRDFARKQAGLSARFLTKQKQLPSGILKNGFPCRTVDRLSTGDVLSFPLPEEVPEYLELLITTGKRDSSICSGRCIGWIRIPAESL